MEGFSFNPSINIPPMSFTTNTIGTTSSSSGTGIPISTSSFVQVRMDGMIWSRLPQTLIDRVIAFLPPPAFFRARSVCRRWYSLLFSDSFLEMYLNISARHHWFLFFKNKSLKSNIYRNNSNGPNAGQLAHDAGINDRHKQQDNICEGYLFDPNEITWYRLSFASVPSGFSPASSSGGLICWVSDNAGNKSIILCNPLLKTLTQLPPTQRPRLFPSIGLTVTRGSFSIVVAGEDLISQFAVKNVSAESFHVDGGRYYSIWGTTCALPRLCSLESGKMVFVEGKFYCMNYSPFSILVYDVGRNECCKIEAPMKRFLRSPSLVECRGRLVLVAAVEKSQLNVPKSLRLWVLQTRESSWVEVERMPQQLYNQFNEAEGGKGFDCVGSGDFITITILGSDRMVLYDFYQKGWQWIPPCPFIRRHCGGHVGGGGDGDGLHGFAYEPQLVTPIMGILTHSSLPYQVPINE